MFSQLQSLGYNVHVLSSMELKNGMSYHLNNLLAYSSTFGIHVWAQRIEVPRHSHSGGLRQTQIHPGVQSHGGSGREVNRIPRASRSDEWSM